MLGRIGRPYVVVYADRRTEPWTIIFPKRNIPFQYTRATGIRNTGNACKLCWLRRVAADMRGHLLRLQRIEMQIECCPRVCFFADLKLRREPIMRLISFCWTSYAHKPASQAHGIDRYDMCKYYTNPEHIVRAMRTMMIWTTLFKYASGALCHLAGIIALIRL